ncbi:MAG: glycosyltransferase [Beijerinckiaceae bacterium]
MVDFALAIAGGLFTAHIASLAFAWRKCRTRAPSRVEPQPRVSLVRPMCGLDYQVEQTLLSSFRQDYCNLEVIFCAARPDDPAAGIARRLIDTHPEVDASLLIGETRLSQNPKLNNMAKAWPQATGDIVVFADSNLLLPPDYCASVAAAFNDASVAVVSAPPVGDHAESFFGEVECAMLNTHAARWQFAASAIGMNFAQGKTLAFRRSAFGDDLMSELASEPAEDAAATKIVRRMGGALRVLAPPYIHPVGSRSLTAFWSRHIRWARLRRVTFPLVFAFEAACGAVPALVALALSPAIPTAALPLALFAAIGAWYGCEYALAKAVGWRTNMWFPLACLFRDAMLPVFYVGAWLSARFEWRGHAMDSAVKQAAT